MPIYTPIYSDKRDGGLAEIIETKETYTERVLEVYEDNGYNDSDFYAVVWDDEQNCLLHKQYATTRFYSEGYGAKVDATPEIIEKAKAEKTKYFLKFAIESDIENAKSIKIGKRVEVTRGRKNRGVIGEVFWVGRPEKFSYHSKEYHTIGIKLNDERDDNGKFKNIVFAYDYNCDVINFETYLTEQSELKKRANLKAKTYSYSAYN